MTADAPLNAETVNELRDILEEGLDELFEEYLADTPSQLQQMRAAAEDDDAAALTSVAHTLKGSSGNLGVAVVYELCRQLEERARAADIGDAAERVAAIEEAFTVARSAIQAEMNG